LAPFTQRPRQSETMIRSIDVIRKVAGGHSTQSRSPRVREKSVAVAANGKSIGGVAII
jgi:hypothetical protein